MTKEELINLIQTLKLEEIKEFKIIYYKERNYGVYDSRNPIVLTINDEGE